MRNLLTGIKRNNEHPPPSCILSEGGGGDGGGVSTEETPPPHLMYQVRKGMEMVVVCRQRNHPLHLTF